MSAMSAAVTLTYIGFLALLLAMYAAYRFAPGGRSMGLWLVAGVLTVLSVVAQSLRAVTSRDIAIAVAVDLTVVAMVTVYAAARRMLGLRSTPWVYGTLAAFGVVSTTWFTVMSPNYLLRSVAYAIVAIPTTLAIATVFLRAREPGLTAMFRVMGVCYGSYAVLTAVNLVGLLTTDTLKEALERPSDVLINQLTVLPGLFLIFLMLVLVTVRRAHAAVADDRDIAEETSQALLADTWSDPLTGLASRARMRSVVAAALAEGVLSSSTLNAFLLTLDGNIADEYGHHVADDAMVALAQRVRHLLGMQQWDWDTAGRWGESSILVVPVLGDQTAQEWALSAQEALRQLVTASGHIFSASVAFVTGMPGTSVEAFETAAREAGAKALDSGPAGVWLA